MMLHQVGDIVDATCLVYVYELFESDTMAVRYVGQTDYPAKRLAVHRCAGKNEPKPKRRWVADLAARGATVQMRIIAIASQVDADFAELAAYGRLVASGAQLLNVAPPCPFGRAYRRAKRKKKPQL